MRCCVPEDPCIARDRSADCARFRALTFHVRERRCKHVHFFSRDLSPLLQRPLATDRLNEPGGLAEDACRGSRCGRVPVSRGSARPVHQKRGRARSPNGQAAPGDPGRLPPDAGRPRLRHPAFRHRRRPKAEPERPRNPGVSRAAATGPGTAPPGIRRRRPASPEPSPPDRALASRRSARSDPGGCLERGILKAAHPHLNKPDSLDRPPPDAPSSSARRARHRFSSSARERRAGLGVATEPDGSWPVADPSANRREKLSRNSR